MEEIIKRNVGKPRKWETPEQLINEINVYLNETPFEQWSVTGLALTLGTSKQLLLDYQKRPEFKDVIDESKLLIEHSYELSLRKNGRTGDIFALKNFDWKDKNETDLTSGGEKFNLNVISYADNNSTLQLPTESIPATISPSSSEI